MKMSDVKKTIGKLTGSKPAMIVLSVAMAILIWFIVSVTLYPSVPVTIYNVPLVVETDGTQAGANGLSMISCDVQTVNVQLEGSRSKVGILTAENLTAYATMDNVTSPGEYPLEITVKSSENVAFEVKNVSPPRANVKFDQIVTREFEVTPAFPGIVISSGHIMDDVTCTPSVIEITGPAAQLDEIENAVVTSSKEEQIDSSYVLYTSDVTLYNKDGSIVDGESLQIPIVNFKIDIPVLTQKELALTYKILNPPSGFDLEWLSERLMLSAESITLASPNNTLAQREDLNLGAIALEKIGLRYSETFDLKIEEGEVNQSGIQQVTLTLDNTGLEERIFSVSGDQIIVINAPSGYDFDIITKKLDVSVIGPPEQLDDLRAADIVVTVDLSNYNPQQGESSSEYAQVIVTNQSRVWAAGTYKIALNRVEREAETKDEE